jgi:four helix bundle protein
MSMPFHQLDVFRKAYDLSLAVHRESLQFPKFEQFELASQLRRSTKSIPANIAEGMGRQMSPKDVQRFLRNALGSCDETRIWLEYARDLGYNSEARFDDLHESYCEVGRMLNGLVSKWRDR